MAKGALWRRHIRSDYGLAAGLFFLALASRLPLASNYLYNGDAVNFALGLERFSLKDYQPHPPGYPLYIALGRLLRPWFSDANGVLVALSIGSGALAVALIYWLGRSIFDRSTALVAALLLMFSPLAWFYSEVALSYEVELLLALLIVWFLYQLFFYQRYPVWTAIAIGAAAGFRSDVLMFLGPLWLIGALRLGYRQMLWSAAALSVAVLAWLAPLIYLSGGWSAYREASSSQFASSILTTSIFNWGFDGLIRHGQEVSQAAVWLLGAAAGSLFLLGVFLSSRLRGDRRRILFLVAAALPALSFFLFFHFGQPGYLLICSGSLFLIIARALTACAAIAADLAGRPGRARPALTSALLAVMVAPVLLVNGALFLKGAQIDRRLPTQPATVAELYGPYSASGLKELDRQKRSLLETVGRFDAAHTLLVGAYPFGISGDTHWLMFYLPRFHLITLRSDSGRGYFQAQNHSYSWFAEEQTVVVPSEFKQLLFLGAGEADLGQWQTAVVSSSCALPIFQAAAPVAEKLPLGPYSFRLASVFDDQ